MARSTELGGSQTTQKLVSSALPPPGEGEVLVAIGQSGLTSNNVSYAIAGDTIGYWGCYPAEGNWGRVPAWGLELKAGR